MPLLGGIMKIFTKDEMFPKGISFCSGETLLKKEDFIIHTHEFSELFLILSGGGTNVIDGKEYDVHPGDVYIINGDVSHGFINVDNLALHNIMFDPVEIFKGNSDIKKMPGFQSLFVFEPLYRKEHEFQSRLQLTPEKMKIAQSYITSLQEEYDHLQGGSVTVLKAYFMLLTVFLCREYERSILNDRSKSVLVIAEAVAFMEKNFTEPIKLADIASIAHVSERHFNRIFSDHYNLSPKQYLIRLRLEYACRLLENSRYQITEIASLSGFSDSNYFARLFRIRYGMSPKQYREIFR
jgi:AraC-like DNA-binding protein